MPALIRAPLMHLYFELIHPFWDGNGRVGRVLEATLLQAAGFRYAPFAQTRYYLEHIDAYFTLSQTRARHQGDQYAPICDRDARLERGAAIPLAELRKAP